MPQRRRTQPKGRKSSKMGEAELTPFARRIGPVFDPAWLKLVDKETLREIAALQLEGVKEMLDIERRTVDQIRNTIVSKTR